MAVISLNLLIFLVLSFLSVSGSTFLPTLSSTITNDATVPPPPPPPPLFTTTPPPQSLQQDFPGQGIFSHTSALAPILSHLGFNELATAAAPLYGESATATTWTGPYTIFAPSDSSILACISCSIPSSSVNTWFPAFSPHKNDLATYKIFIGGVEITHPDLFNNGLIVVHGLQGYISHLSPFSCDVERMTSSLALQFHYDHNHNNQLFPQQHVALMRFMLRDVILRLRNSGFSVLSLALKLKYAELVSLRNVTIFALDDVSIFSGSYSYISSVRLHILPNQLLTIADLERLPVGTTLTTLDRDQSLVVTTEGGIIRKQMRINYVSIKVADMMRNLNVIVHSLYLPFHVYPMAATTDSTLGGEDQSHQTTTAPGA
ncbi:26S proteasome non-ATPase regulatory subunit [Hibiscus syriacus]|uniref:26S proteasome non-ATPase regulatory subunit n=1 Tax=Hibiscus syriacus TaxID=106335 RepID=A0A6A2ZHS2_HIBSY|nr:26S proteasome non-ATPase regulatory subunit [Hibiscus syriacus]